MLGAVPALGELAWTKSSSGSQCLGGEEEGLQSSLSSTRQAQQLRVGWCPPEEGSLFLGHKCTSRAHRGLPQGPCLGSTESLPHAGWTAPGLRVGVGGGQGTEVV